LLRRCENALSLPDSAAAAVAADDDAEVADLADIDCSSATDELGPESALACGLWSNRQKNNINLDTYYPETYQTDPVYFLVEYFETNDSREGSYCTVIRVT